MSPIRRIAVIQGHSVLEYGQTLDLKGSVSYVSDGDVDCDGLGDDGLPNNIYNDPYYQPETSLKQLNANGQPQSLNALRDKYIVVNPKVLRGVVGVVLGCQALVVDLRTGLWSWAVCGDIGPTLKDGELSVACAKAIQIPPSPINGGCDTPDLCYVIWPGRAGYVDGRSYTLQPS